MRWRANRALTYVGYRPLPVSGSAESQAALTAVNELLDGIIREASGAK